MSNPTRAHLSVLMQAGRPMLPAGIPIERGMQLTVDKRFLDGLNGYAEARNEAEIMGKLYQTARVAILELDVEASGNTPQVTIRDYRIAVEFWPLCANDGKAAIHLDTRGPHEDPEYCIEIRKCVLDGSIYVPAEVYMPARWYRASEAVGGMDKTDAILIKSLIEGLETQRRNQ